MKILVTGGAGFIGSNFVKYWVNKYPKDEITVLDKLTYAGRKENLDDVLDNIRFIYGDICDKDDVYRAMNGCKRIFHFAAETHVDRSISRADTFVKTNVVGTHTLLETARMVGVDQFIHISTDEVYGSTTHSSFVEGDPLNPTSPYAATKAASDLLALSYYKTYGLPVIVTRSSNNYGPFQYPEKLVPVMILNALGDKHLPVYGDGLQVRDWLYVEDNCAGIETAAQEGHDGKIYNIAANNELTNIEVVKMILKLLGKSEDLISYVKDRIGHDQRYAIKTWEIERLGWRPKVSFEEGLKKTIDWYMIHRNWWSQDKGW